VDVWGIDRTGVVTTPSGQQVVNREQQGLNPPGEFVERDPATGNILRVTTLFLNAASQKAKGVDFGIQYQYQIPGGWGTVTSLTQATYLDSFEQQNLLGQFKNFVPPGAIHGDPDNENELSGRQSTGTSDDAYLKWKGASRLDWAWHNLDINATVHYTAGFKEEAWFGLHFGHPKGEHFVKGTWIFDTQATYDFSFAPPVESTPVAGYSKDGKEMVRGKDGKAVETGQTANYSMPCWKNLLNNTSFTLGCNNVFGQDPPNAYGPFNGNATFYPGFIYDPTGRFVYASITHKF
jgi:hypothetical protein